MIYDSSSQINTDIHEYFLEKIDLTGNLILLMGTFFQVNCQAYTILDFRF